MILWALLVGISVTLASGKLDATADVQAVFLNEADCKVIKKQLDKGSSEALKAGAVDPTVNSFGSACVPVPLDQHQKPKIKGA